MSTDRNRKRKRAILRVERIKIIEYVCIGLVILLFLGLGIYYGSGGRLRNANGYGKATASPSPTEDTSVRGVSVFAALEDGGFDVAAASEGYTVTVPNGVTFLMKMRSDDKGIVSLSFETPLCADPKEAGAVNDALREKNRQTTDALRELFDRIMPVFHRSVYDSETVVKQCQKVVQKGESYSKHFGSYSVRILSDVSDVPQLVNVMLQRDS